MKLFSVLTLIFWGLICALVTAGHRFPRDNYFCSSNIFKAISGVESGCHYQVYFDKTPNPKELVTEKLKLDNFIASGKLETHLHWYKKSFDRRFRDIFDLSIEDVNSSHWRYLKLNPSDINSHILHVNFLAENGLNQLAKSNLDDYCKMYIKRYRADVLTSFKSEIAKYDSLSIFSNDLCAKGMR